MIIRTTHMVIRIAMIVRTTMIIWASVHAIVRTTMIILVFVTLSLSRSRRHIHARVTMIIRTRTTMVIWTSVHTIVRTAMIIRTTHMLVIRTAMIVWSTIHRTRATRHSTRTTAARDCIGITSNAGRISIALVTTCSRSRITGRISIAGHSIRTTGHSALSTDILP